MSPSTVTNGISSNANGDHGYIHPATKLRRIIEDPNGFIMCPGVYDGYSARIALSVGCDGLYMTGAGTTASRLGLADLGVTSLNDMRAHAEMIANIDSSIPLIADADTGYGGPIGVARTLDQYIRSGVAGLHIEDQVQTKRCGHLAGKQLVDTAAFVSRIKAAHAARLRNQSDIVVIARTDSLQGYGYDEAIDRLKKARDAGADVAFFEAITSKEQARQVVKDLAPFPCLLNMVEHGPTPTISAQEAKEMGFKVMIVPFAGLEPAYYAMKAGYERLQKTGLTGSNTEFTPQMLFRAVGMEQSMNIDKEAGASLYAGGID